MTKKNESAEERNTDPEYNVGYKRPPKHTQFKPGQSGNPRGRPKESKNLRTDLAEVLNGRIVVREGDKQQGVTKQRAVLMSLASKALKGDTRSARILMDLSMRLLDTGAVDVGDIESLDEGDLKILKRHEERVLRRHQPDMSSGKDEKAREDESDPLGDDQDGEP